MEKSYLSILTAKETVLVVKKSKFICNMSYVANKKEAEDFIQKIKLKYKDAKHNVSAYNLYLGGINYYSDDKEPRGTAGRQVLTVLKKEKIFDVCAVVTRYFGGILLGTGGLSLAYSTSCKQTLKEAVVVNCAICVILNIKFSYKDLKNIENLLTSYNIKKLEEKYSSDILYKLVVKENDFDVFKEKLLEITKGNIKILSITKRWERL